jgi:DNA ligase (NAD+)
MERLLTAIGIPGVGPATCKSLARRFDNFDALRLAGRVELLAIDGVSEKAAINLHAFFASPGGQRMLERFRKLEMI